MAIELHTSYVLTQNNIGGVYDERFPKQALISAKSLKSAIAYAESLGVDFSDYCGCCGQRWWIADFESGFHSTKLPSL